jgi:hypothetical protein
VKEAASRLMISPALLYALCAACRIRHERHGLGRGKILISESAIQEYRQGRTIAVAVPAQTTLPVTPRLRHLKA